MTSKVSKDEWFFKAVAFLLASKKAEILNARGEFACNSSSSHSIVVMPSDTKLADSSVEGSFGSGDFALTSSTSKVRYLAALLADNFDTKELANELRASLPEWSSSDYVDSQSTPYFPKDRFGNVQEEFIKDLASLFASPDVAILGGRDDDYDSMPAGSVNFPLPDHSWQIRKDTHEELSWWTLFSAYDGTKIRLRLGEDVTQESLKFFPERSSFPELVDVKVTDRCAFEKDCGFCYMGSTVKGVEGDMSSMMTLVAALADLQVFEIAFGGGEPTLWPGFVELMRFCRSLGVVPNFTTKNYAAFKHEPALLEEAGSVAVSINDLASLKKLDKGLAGVSHWDGREKVTIQVIPEIVTDEVLDSILTWAVKEDVRVTFLGYKSTGRGNLFEGRIARPDDFWIKIAKRHPALKLAIDTVLALKCQSALKKAGVPDWCYHTEEGKFSLYVDAVTGEVGPSSYCSKEERKSLDFSKSVASLAKDILEEFRTY